MGINIRYKPRETTTVHTKLSYYLVLVAIIVEFINGLMYINSSINEDKTFGTICLLEAGLGIIAFILTDIIMTGKITVKLSKQRFQTLKPFFILTVVVITLLLISIQYFVVPLTVRQENKALAIIFAAPCEEMIFRGLILSFFMRLSENSNKYVFYKNNRTKTELSLSKIEVIGILLSGAMFMVFHTNYYGESLILLTIFYSGCVYATVYILSKSLTSVIIAHFLLNFSFVINTFFMVSF